ncbi:growth/differentiation factor 9-like isoform X1 [Gadus chalcogrammus]|uniref:growth/differentiation factor 9-like isoform X2 n=1 Tax=Gadus chalcogrammus TaxID=1042646 RepID=UPI0024C47A7A|nr:growth/differentiation factor 9-like isoform X2 [Gadus chalcogrammus]XP_056456753.1 growth/differentiation factor 9-like isoform X1 [Gadus chalcogrammus]
MGTQMLMSTLLYYFNTVLLLHVVFCHCEFSHASSNAEHTFDGYTQYPYENLFTPLLKALSEHGKTRWNAELNQSVKPELKYMKYMVEVHKKSRGQRSLDSNDLFNTLRLIKPLEKCLDQRNAPSPSLCYLNIKEREDANQCHLCPSTDHQVMFTVHHAYTPQWKNWVEVDITTLLLPILKIHKKTVHLLVHLNCSAGLGPLGEGGSATLFPSWSPPLLLYLNDTSKSARQKSAPPSRAGQRSPMDEPLTSAERSAFKLQQMLRRKRRLRRAPLKTKGAGQSLDLHLPELLPSSEYPTSDCALYDFKVGFSQLKLDHWIVFPPKYNPRYCRGTCPSTLGFFYHSPIHTMVQNIIYEKLDTTVPRPACVPSHYSPLSVMLFEEDGSYVYKQFDEMVATRCTCR